MIDQTDLHILYILLGNARMQWREIGEQVHLTGQAVANRIRKMEDLGIIEGYTVRINQSLLGKSIIAYVTVFMKTTDHNAFHQYIKQTDAIAEANQISGDGCYLLKLNISSQDELLKYLNDILRYGNYRVNLSIGKIKG